MGDNKQLKLALEGESQIEIFQKSEVRKVLNEGEWWFSVADVLEVLADVKDGSDYSKTLRKRDEGLREGWGQIVTPLPFDTEGGMQNINFVSIEGIFRIMQSVPTKKAEPFKKWLAKVGFERVQEFENPELAIKRAIAIYHAKGYPPEWIDARIPNKIARQRLEEMWSARGIKLPVEFAVLTSSISEETFGLTVKEHKSIKALGKSHGLRDNMTPIELTLTTLAEQATKEIAESTNANNFYAHKIAAKTGGSIAGQARNEIEKVTGNDVVSRTNYLTERQRKTNIEKTGEQFENVIKEISDSRMSPKKKGQDK